MSGLTPEQLQERNKYICATDAAVICGLSPYKNRIELYNEKVGQQSEMQVSEEKTRIFKAGHYLEPVIAQWFRDETNKTLEVDESLKVHPNIPYVATHIDRLVKGENAAVECKSSRYGHGFDFEHNTMPMMYLVQCAHEAMVWEFDRVYCAVLIGGNEFNYCVYERNKRLEQALIDKYKEFWQCVQNEIAPDPLTAEEVISLYGSASENESVFMTSEIDEALENLQQLKMQKKTTESLIKTNEDKIKVYMGKNDTLVGFDNDVKVTWKTTKPIKSFDSKRLQLEHPEIYSKFLNEKPGHRRFLIK